MMGTQIVKIPEAKNFREEIREAGRIIKAGGLVAFPTETVYGLGADGWNAEACADIYKAKGRPSDNPLILHVANRDMLEMAAAEIPLMAEQLMAAFCPGPLTLILRKSPAVPKQVTGGLDTVGIRMPDNDIARMMIGYAGRPVAAPSANLSGRPSPTTAEAVRADMEGKIPMILDGGPCSFGVESTIVDCTGEQAVILRPGAVTLEMLEEVVGETVIDPALLGKDEIPRAPGMKYRHYAPKVPMFLMEGAAQDMQEGFRREILRLQQEGRRAGVIASSEVLAGLEDLLPREVCVSYGEQGNLRKIAARLYEALRSFDDKPVDILLAEGTEEKGIGLAVMNRLHKASGFHSVEICREKEGSYAIEAL